VFLPTQEERYEMPEFQLDKITVYYESIGEGRPLLVLPGWTASAKFAAYFMEPLLTGTNEFNRIYLDLPGHGRTPGPVWITNLDDMLSVAVEFIEAVLGEQRFILVGHSLGAYLARGVLLSKADQVDGLMMLVPAITIKDAERNVPPPTVLYEDPSFREGFTVKELERVEILALRDLNVKTWLKNFPEDPEAAGDPEFLQAIREDPNRYTLSFDVDAKLAPFEKPTLIVTGRQDFVTGYQDAWALLENYPRATFAVLDRAGHFLEAKNHVLEPLVREWLKAVREEQLS
jgi:pimeloyl-ACP methyl ester carboxylesterase